MVTMATSFIIFLNTHNYWTKATKLQYLHNKEKISGF